MYKEDKLKVLIIDDDPIEVAILDNAISNKYTRQVLLDGSKTIKHLDDCASLPDLILLDVVMPNIDGYEVCRQIKNNPRYRSIPIIFVSGLTEAFDKVNAFKAGAVDYITKPFHSEEIVARIETHLEVAKSKKVIFDLYTKTIHGTINAMNDMLSIANPEISGFSNTMHSLTLKLLKKVSLSNVWDLKIASQLASVGALTGDFNNIQSFDKITLNRFLMFSSEIVENIPRLDPVAKILNDSMRELDSQYYGKTISQIPDEIVKSQIIRTIFHFVIKKAQMGNYISALKAMKDDNDERYIIQIIEVLTEILEEIAHYNIMVLDLCQLKSGLVIAEDVKNKDGRILLKAGYELTDSIISILKNYEYLKISGVKVLRKDV